MFRAEFPGYTITNPGAWGSDTGCAVVYPYRFLYDMGIETYARKHVAIRHQGGVYTYSFWVWRQRKVSCPAGYYKGETIAPCGIRLLAICGGVGGSTPMIPCIFSCADTKEHTP